MKLNQPNTKILLSQMETEGSNMCEKLYKAFVPTRPLHRLPFRKHEPEPPKASAASKAKPAEQGFTAEGQLINIQTLDLSAPPAPPVAKGEKARRSNSLKKRADDFIERTRMKLRAGSAVGRHGS